ncbi:MAG: NUDIX domain-containing protein [Alsobacter sp.]
MTLGVRAAILHPDKGVFLVKHSYVAGWHLPGGGVEAGETILASMMREVEEEANIEVTGEPVLHGVFFNIHASRRDHVVVYVVTTFTERGPRLPDREIVEASFFPLDGLPVDTTRGTRERLDEIAGHRPLSPTW